MTIVVKLGGARAVEPYAMIDDVAHLTANDERVAIAHGGSTAIDAMLDRLGETPEYVETPDGVVGRFTDAATMKVVTRALAGVNTELVTALHGAGVRALGLSGVDGGLITGTWRSAIRVRENGRDRIRRGAHAGTVESVDESLLTTILDEGFVPVITGPMLGVDGGECAAVNVDADRLAGAIAATLAGDLVMLTDVPGVLADPADRSSRISVVDDGAALEAVESAASGFMTRKVMAVTEALEQGARRVIVTDANRPEPVLSGLAGAGTHFRPEALESLTEVDGG